MWSGWLGYLYLLYGGIPFGWNLTPSWTWSLFFDKFYSAIASAHPHTGYYALKRLQEERFHENMSIITMNVDGFHQSSGFADEDVAEVHGTIKKFRCSHCQMKLTDIVTPTRVCPRCPSCGGYGRPDVTLFTEQLPEKEWTKATAMIGTLSANDVVLIIGTSSVVYPAASLPGLASRRGCILIEINPQTETPLQKLRNIHLQGTAASVLVELADSVLS